MRLVISRFDEVIAEKANKSKLSDLKIYIDEEFIKKDANEKFVVEQKRQTNATEEKVNKVEELLKYQAR